MYTHIIKAKVIERWAAERAHTRTLYCCVLLLPVTATSPQRQSGEQPEVAGDPRRRAEGDALVEGGRRRHHQDAGQPVRRRKWRSVCVQAACDDVSVCRDDVTDAGCVAGRSAAAVGQWTQLALLHRNRRAGRVRNYCVCDWTSAQYRIVPTSHSFLDSGQKFDAKITGVYSNVVWQ